MQAGLQPTLRCGFQPRLMPGVGCLALEVMRQCENLLLSPEACMSYPRVILVGGAPMSGKTTVTSRLAATLGYGCLSTDDLGEALRAVTTKDLHPHLHPTAGYDCELPRDRCIARPHHVEYL